MSHSILATSHPILAMSHLSYNSSILAKSHPILATYHPILITSHHILTTSHLISATSHPILASSHPILATSHLILATSHPILATLLGTIKHQTEDIMLPFIESCLAPSGDVGEAGQLALVYSHSVALVVRQGDLVALPAHVQYSLVGSVQVRDIKRTIALQM
jgi:hypothetical protein